MKFDDVLSEVNGFGKFQIRLFLIQMLSRITLPPHLLLNNFMAAVPSHHCNVTPLDDQGLFWNLTQEQLLAVSVPTEPDGSPSSCQMFSKPQYQRLHGLNSSEDAVAVPCREGWVYDNSTFASTIATEWDLVCSRKWMNKATATIFFIGVMVGAPLCGFLSDREYANEKLMFNAKGGSKHPGVDVPPDVEWVSVEHRTFSGIIICLDVTVGNCIGVGIAYCVNEWRMLILAVTSPLVLSVIAWRWLPESARWLLANGKAEAAHRYIRKCAEINNRTKCLESVTPEVLLESAETPCTDKKYTFLDLFKTPNIRKLSVCIGIICRFLVPTVYSPSDKWIFRTVMAVLGKALSEASCANLYLYTTELFPTVVRQNGLGYSSFVAWVGVSISPLVMLLEDVWQLLPHVVYCAAALGSGLLILLLPETLNNKLPELIEDIEKPK
ncbi:unnamed protein product [Tetraodon nigroviridis]|uniref:(spotted green pufferfish) hypothetical protein n=1 Tax=Tetraodon nigroviridis TaxID=99883 RepID=Q4S6K0_TETNG|nr:unnamed protein product [Tetraodon nigroviridis]